MGKISPKSLKICRQFYNSELVKKINPVNTTPRKIAFKFKKILHHYIKYIIFEKNIVTHKLLL